MLRLALSPGKPFLGPRPGTTYLLEKRYTDPNVDRVLTHLAELDRRPDSRFLDLIERPHQVAGPLEVDPAIRRRALELARKHGMTPSQLAAFEGIVGHGLRLVWGPPGTGKTHFLALAVLCLAEAHRAAGRPFRTLLTAFTHAAIDNALRKAAEIQGERGIVRGSFPIGKLGDTRLAGMEGVRTVPPKTGKTGWRWSDDEPVSPARRHRLVDPQGRGGGSRRPCGRR